MVNPTTNHSHIEFVYNSTPKFGIGTTHFEVDIGYISNEPLMNMTNGASTRNTTAHELTMQLSVLTLLTRDFLKERQESMQTQENPPRQECTFAVGDYLLLDLILQYNCLEV